MEYRELFHLSFVSGDGHQVASAPDLLISEVKSRRYWDTAVIEPSQGNFRASTLSSTRATVLWSSASRDEASWDWFLVSGSTFGPSAVEINLGGQALDLGRPAGPRNLGEGPSSGTQHRLIPVVAGGC